MAIVNSASQQPIYVETLVRAPLEEVWTATQRPQRHQRWDVRFGSITYQDRDPRTGQRRFTYATTVWPGVTVDGYGRSSGSRIRPDGSYWSGLQFHSDDRRSLIERGSGYWRYVPTDHGVRFLTRYDYRPRWGPVGGVIDRWVFRPLFGWATAWSFDRLRLWLEQGIPPERSRNRALAHGAALVAIPACVGGQIARPQDSKPRLFALTAGLVALLTTRDRPSGRRPRRRPLAVDQPIRRNQE